MIYIVLIYNLKKWKHTELMSKKKEEWIQKDIKTQIPKLDCKKINIPNLDELFY